MSAFQVNDGLSDQDKAFLQQSFQQLSNRMFDPKTQYENSVFEQQRQQLAQRQKLDELVAKGYVDQNGNVSPEGQAFLTQSVYQRPILGRIQQMFGGSPQMTTRGQQMGLNPMAGPQQMNLAPQMGPVNVPSPSQNVNQLGIPQSAQTMGQIFGQNGGDLSPEQRTNMAPILRMFGGQRLSEIPAAFQSDILPPLKQPESKARIPKSLAHDAILNSQMDEASKASMISTLSSIPGEFLDNSQYAAFASGTKSNAKELDESFFSIARQFETGKIDMAEFLKQTKYIPTSPKKNEEIRKSMQARDSYERDERIARGKEDTIKNGIRAILKKAAATKDIASMEAELAIAAQANGELGDRRIKFTEEGLDELLKETGFSKLIGSRDKIRQVLVDGGFIEDASKPKLSPQAQAIVDRAKKARKK